MHFIKSAPLCAALVAASAAATAATPEVQWTKLFGTAAVDQAIAVDTDAVGNVYVTGRTAGSLDGPNAGGYDVFLRKYNPLGALQWDHQFGTSADDQSWGLAVDPSGDIVIVGDTQGRFDGSGAAQDAFVAKFDPSGNHLWTEQFRDNLASQALDVDADMHGNLYVSGGTYRSVGGILGTTPDGFVTKFDATGSRGWTRQFGEIFNDLAWGVSADASGNVYVSGESQNDVFLRKYDADGLLAWDREIATTGYEKSRSVSVDELGNIFIAGNSGMAHGGVNYGRFDALVAKYDAEGSLQWVRQTGSSENDGAARIATDGLGNAYIVGFTMGSLEGASLGSGDVLVAKYDAAGELVWQEQLGTVEVDNGLNIVVDDFRNLYLVGTTLGNFGGAGAGRDDAFLLKLTEPMQPDLAADFNDSGAIDGEDLAAWVAYFGEDASADADGDSDSDGADFLVWQRQLRADLQATAAASSVPEPSAICLVLCIAGWRIRVGRRSTSDAKQRPPTEHAC